MSASPPMTAAVCHVLDSYPGEIRAQIVAIRSLIFETAAAIDGVGPIAETLKWGEPAYLTPSGSGTTIRLAWKPKHPAQFGMFVHCQTTLIETFRELAPKGITFEGNRAMIFQAPFAPAKPFLVAAITAALTYHRSCA